MKDYKELNKLWKKFVFNENLWIDEMILAEEEKETDFEAFQRAAAKTGLANRDREIEKGDPEVDLSGGTDWAYVTKGSLYGPITGKQGVLSNPVGTGGDLFVTRTTATGETKHMGIDIGSMDNNIHAIADGVVIKATPVNEYTGYAGWFLKFLAIPAKMKKGWKFYDEDDQEIEIPDKLHAGNFAGLKEKVLYISKVTNKEGNTLNAVRDIRPFLKQQAKNYTPTIQAGGTIVIQHNKEQIQSWYMHLGSMQVTKNSSVTAGQVIGAVGKTGIFDPPDGGGRPHLHFEVRKLGKTKGYLDFRKFYSTRR